MRAAEIMTTEPVCCSPDDSVQDVARAMRAADCGSIPVVDPDSNCVVGIVTDRDLALRALAEGKGADTKIRDVMSPGTCCCGPAADLREVEQIMADNQVRRVPVVDAAGRCVGVIAQADLARAAEARRVSEHEVAVVIERISEPARVPIERGRDSGLEQRL